MSNSTEHICFFESDATNHQQQNQPKWYDLARQYTLERCNLEGVFPPSSRLFAVGDIHGDFGLLYVILLHVLRVIAPVTGSNGKLNNNQSQVSQCRCGFQEKRDLRQPNPSQLNTLGDVLHSCTYEWIAPPGTWVVFLGDMLDRRRPETLKFSANNNNTDTDHPNHTHSRPNPSQFDGEIRHEEAAILDFINYVAVLADRAHNGGKVIKVLGNHEFMNLDREWDNEDYVTPQAIQDTGKDKGMAGRKQAFAFRGYMRQKLMMCGCYALVQIGNGLFMHGGLNRALTAHPAFRHLFLPPNTNEQQQQQPHAQQQNEEAEDFLDGSKSTVPQMNSLLWQWLHLNDRQSQHQPEHKALNALATDDMSVTWERQLSDPESPMITTLEFDNILHSCIRACVNEDTYLVVGHCVQTSRAQPPSQNGINPSYKFGRLLAEDSKSSGPYKLVGPANLVFNRWIHNAGEQSSNQQHEPRTKFASDNAAPGPPPQNLKHPWCGINFQCPISGKIILNTEKSFGRVFMCDCAMSRAFDIEEETRSDEYESWAFKCRAPQALQILWNEEKSEFEASILISKTHTARRWLPDLRVKDLV